MDSQAEGRGKAGVLQMAGEDSAEDVVQYPVAVVFLHRDCSSFLHEGSLRVLIPRNPPYPTPGPISEEYLSLLALRDHRFSQGI